MTDNTGVTVAARPGELDMEGPQTKFSFVVRCNRTPLSRASKTLYIENIFSTRLLRILCTGLSHQCYNIDAVPVHSAQLISLLPPFAQPEGPAEQPPARRPYIFQALTKHDTDKGTHGGYTQGDTREQKHTSCGQGGT